MDLSASFQIFRKLFALILSCLVFSLNYLFGHNDLLFSRISVEEGLSQSTVYSIMQDSHGFMWFGTRTGGLNKYDGYEFSTFRNDLSDTTSISDNEVISLLEDMQNFIWVGTRHGGLNKLDPSTGKFQAYPLVINNKILKDYKVNDLLLDAADQLWVGTNKGLYIFNREKNRLSLVLPDSVSGIISRMASFDNSRLILSSRERIVFYHIHTGETSVVEFDPNAVPGTSEDKFVPVLVDYLKNVWVGSVEGLLLFNVNDNGEIMRYQPFANYPYILNTDIRTINEDQQRNIWIGTYDGLVKYSGYGQGFYVYKSQTNRPGTLSHNSIRSFLEDRNGNLWVGTWGGGVNFYSSWQSNFNPYSVYFKNPDATRNKVVSSFAEYQRSVWVGTELGGLIRFDTITGNTTIYTFDAQNERSMSSDHIKAIFVDSSNQLWVGTFGRGGLNRFNPQTGTFDRFFNGLRIFSIAETTNGTLWLGTMEGLYQISREGALINHWKYNPNHPLSLASDIVMKLFVDSRNFLWVGTKGGGLNLIDSNGNFSDRFFSDQSTHSHLPSNDVFSLEEDLNGNIWIGTANGLSVFDIHVGDFVENPLVGKLNDSVINGILCDGNGDIWFSTNKGLSCFRISDSLVKNYTYIDGLQSNEYNRASSFKSEAGKLFFGGINGFNAFYPTNIKTNPIAPKVYITSFNCLGESGFDFRNLYTMADHEMSTIKLTWRQTSFSIDYVALNYLLSQKNEFAYMLEGYNTDWIYNGNKRTTSFMNLKPGSYRFRIKASNNDGLWQEADQVIHIRILPPPWRTRYAIIALFLVITSLLLFLRYLQSLRIRERSKKHYEEKEQQRLEEFSKKKLIFLAGLSQQIKDPLTLIASPFNKLKKTIKEDDPQISYLTSVIERNVDRLAELIDRLICFIEVERNRGSQVSIDSLQSLLDNNKSFPCTTTKETPELKKDVASANLDDGVHGDDYSKQHSEHTDETLNKDDWANWPGDENIILVVEDDPEMREYLVLQLDKYRVIEAADGIDGLDKAIHNLPDIIISDVMMPEMGGFELCKAIKENYITSHIPVILLTAKTGVDNKILGLETGAEAFIEKPFSLDHLNAQIGNLLKQRSELKRVFSSQEHGEEPGLTIPRHQQVFLSKAAEIIQSNIDNSEFSVEQFCEELGLSRSQLFRKFKVIIDETPAEFIKSQRLLFARNLLKDSDLTINEICYSAGFSNPSYFITLFRKRFGETPKEFANKFKK
jgi:ligand-binding sensor domain-containing protein/DNA-binding response OmpR family regulator